MISTGLRIDIVASSNHLQARMARDNRQLSITAVASVVKEAER